jgi:tetratricopeptide (TPR) repeat protein
VAKKRNHKPPRNKPPSVNQRRRAQAKGAASSGKSDGAAAHKPDFRINKAQRLWGLRRYEEAIWYYERALARNPHNPVLLVDVARAYALRFRYADAEKLIALAENLHSDDPRFYEMLGRSCVQIQQFDRAIRCYRRALELEPASAERPKILLELAKMHERLHDLDAARACAEEALAIQPGFEKARYTQANIERRAGNIELAESLWRRIIDEKRAPPGVIAESWYELAALYDKAGQYDESFDALTHAKAIFSQAATPFQEDADAIARSSGKAFAQLTTDHFERWAEQGKSLSPLGGGLALLTSHPRSGTTLLEQVLDSHPQLTSADELQVMSEVVHSAFGRTARPDEPMIERYDRGTVEEIEEYRGAYWNGMEGALREPIGERMLLDKNPELTGLLPLVARVFPDMRILFALRDPRDVVVSCFSQRLPLNAVSVHYLTLEGTARKYARSMRNWLKIRSMLKNPWLEFRYEDTVADIEAQARKALDFLGLPWDDVVLEYHRRAQKKHVHSPTYEAVTKPVYTSSINRWRNYATQLEPCMEILQPYIEAFGYEP